MVDGDQGCGYIAGTCFAVGVGRRKAGDFRRIVVGVVVGGGVEGDGVWVVPVAGWGVGRSTHGVDSRVCGEILKRDVEDYEMDIAIEIKKERRYLGVDEAFKGPVRRSRSLSPLQAATHPLV